MLKASFSMRMIYWIKREMQHSRKSKRISPPNRLIRLRCFWKSSKENRRLLLLERRNRGGSNTDLFLTNLNVGKSKNSSRETTNSTRFRRSRWRKRVWWGLGPKDSSCHLKPTITMSSLKNASGSWNHNPRTLISSSLVTLMQNAQHLW